MDGTPKMSPIGCLAPYDWIEAVQSYELDDLDIDTEHYDLGGYDDFGGYDNHFDVDPGDFGGDDGYSGDDDFGDFGGFDDFDFL